MVGDLDLRVQHREKTDFSRLQLELVTLQCPVPPLPFTSSLPLLHETYS